jgi:hypothetical protein
MDKTIDCSWGRYKYRLIVISFGVFLTSIVIGGIHSEIIAPCGPVMSTEDIIVINNAMNIDPKPSIGYRLKCCIVDICFIAAVNDRKYFSLRSNNLYASSASLFFHFVKSGDPFLRTASVVAVRRTFLAGVFPVFL